jgi:ketosteroid isomerase-like protein
MRMPNGSGKPWFSAHAEGIVRPDPASVATPGIPMTSIRLAVAALALALSPLAVAQTTATPKLSAAECEVWARELGFARSVAEHDGDAFAGFIAEGAVFGAKRPNPRRGRDAVVAAWSGLVAGKELRLSWYPAMVAIGGEADVASSSGPALYEDLSPGTKQRFLLGAFQSIWHRDADGAWRVLFDDGIEPQPASEAEVAAFRAGRREACPRG